MNKIKKIFQVCKSFSFVFFAMFFCFQNLLFAEVKIISPATEQSRVWANKQVLVINATENEEIFYSFSGDDPLSSGFAYDGPVLLDVVGDVKLKIACINKKNEKFEYFLDYTVQENQNQTFSSLEESEFIKSLIDSPIKELPVGTELKIPETFEYAIDASGKNAKFDFGRPINVSDKSNLERFFSLTVKSNAGTFWNFVIHSVPQTIAEFSKTAVPFEFVEWSKLKFVDTNYIYSIDDGWWQPAGKTVELDRSVEHFIKWQNVDYDSTNPIHSFKIAPMPKIFSTVNPDASVTLTFDGDKDFRFSKTNSTLSSALSNGLYKEIIVDAFYGENFSLLLPVDIYYQNVLQGKIYTFVQVNRAKPNAPKVVANPFALNVAAKDGKGQIVCNNFLNTRSATKIDFVSDEIDQNIMYQILGPFDASINKVQFNNKNFNAENIKISSEDFVKYDGSEILLDCKNDEPAMYVIACYAIDKWNNISEVCSVVVNINKCDYFINTEYVSDYSKQDDLENNGDFYLAQKCPDGSYENPFTDFSQVENIINNNSYSRFYIIGKVDFPKSIITLKQNAKFVGLENAEIVFSDKSSLYVVATNLEVENILLKNIDAKSENNSVFFNLENSVLSLENVDASFERFQNATLINALNSVVSIKNSMLVSLANDYSCAVALQKSKANIVDSKIATVALTNVNFSCKDSTFNLSNSSCKVTGFNGRIAEFFNCTGSVLNNSFELKNNQKKSKNISIWNDEFSLININGNKTIGF